MSRFAWGLPFHSTRSLSETEVRRIVEARRRSFRARVAWGFATALLPVYLSLAIVIPLAVPTPWLGFSLAGFFLALCVIAPLRWSERRKEDAILRVAVEETEAERYQSEGSESEPPYWLERLPRSGLLLSTKDEAPKATVMVPVSDVAPMPESTHSDDAFPARMPAFSASVDGVPRRPLSAAEVQELERSVDRMRPRMKWWQILVQLYVMFGIVVLLLRPNRSDSDTIRMVLMIALVAWIGRSLYIVYRQRAVLRRDLAQASVFQTRTEGRDVEFLPESHMLWSVDGKPAAWRHVITEQE